MRTPYPKFLTRSPKLGLILNKTDLPGSSVALSEFYGFLNAQEETKNSRSYPIPVPMEDVKFDFIMPISAKELDTKTESKLIQNLFRLLPPASSIGDHNEQSNRVKRKWESEGRPSEQC